MSLMNRFKKIAETGDLGTVNENVPYYKTGIDIFDYVNGCYGPDWEKKLGLPGGKIYTNIGESGTGKTSVTIQQACHIAEQNPNSSVIHLDFERSTSKERVMQISGWNSKMFDEKYMLITNIFSETVFDWVENITKIKMESYNDIIDENGELPPTIIILDSIAMMIPKDIDEDSEVKGSMSAAAIAKVNTQVFKRVVSRLGKANIILMPINHITKKIEINPYAKSKAVINYLAQDESLPGGKAPTYLANTLSKLEAGSKLEIDKDYGIKGFYINGKLCKSRSNTAGTTFTMVFNQVTGIDNILTNYYNLKEAKRIVGGGRSMYLDSCSNVKFTAKTFKDTYKKNKELREAFDIAVDEEYSKYLKLPESENAEFDPARLIYDKDNDIYYDPQSGKYYEKNNKSFNEVTVVEEDENE